MFIEVKNLKKAYKNGKVQSEILKGVSFDVKAGEILTILGPSGSGKSTLIKVLTGVEEFETGEIIMDGKSIINTSPQEAGNNGISTVYQEVNMCPNLTVAENIFIRIDCRTEVRSIREQGADEKTDRHSCEKEGAEPVIIITIPKEEKCYGGCYI